MKTAPLSFYPSLAIGVCFLLCPHHLLLGASPPFPEDQPWLTGPLLTPSARVVNPGHLLVEPYLFWTEIDGRYNQHGEAIKVPRFYQASPQLSFKVGIFDRVNFSISPQSYFNYTKHSHSSGFDDLPFGFDIQLVTAEKEGYPVKLSLQEIFPIGNYQNLEPSNEGTDVGGLGSYGTLIALTVGKLTHFSGENFLNARLNFSTLFFTPVDIRGLSVYGGDPTTRGKVYPGTSFNLLGGAELTLNKNIALSLDILAQYSLRTRFRGQTLLSAAPPTSGSISLAPALEYNWNSSVGVIAGCWFSVAGRNASRFRSYVGAVNLYF